MIPLLPFLSFSKPFFFKSSRIELAKLKMKKHYYEPLGIGLNRFVTKILF